MSVRTGKVAADLASLGRGPRPQLRFGLMVGIIFVLIGCAQKHKDVCRVPSAPSPQTPAELEEFYGDRAAALTPEVNAEADYDFCLRSKAYAARMVQDSMTTVAHGVTAQCEFKFDIWQGFVGGKWGKMNDSLGSVVAFERKEDEAAKARQALALVLEYRSCAAGQAQDRETPSEKAE